MTRQRLTPARPTLEPLEARWNPVRFDFRYDYDATGGAGFFDSQTRVQALEAAGKEVAAYLGDRLTAIAPDAARGNRWMAQFFNPATGASVLKPDLAVPDDVLVVYVGGRATLSRDGGLAFAAPGTVDKLAGTPAFQEAVRTRGQLGAWGLEGKHTDFGPWGGSISFDTSANWYFGADPAGAGAGQVHFRATVLHELGHILGYGSSDSWFDNIQQYAANANWYFTGVSAVAAFGGNAVPVDLSDSDGAHWARGVVSPDSGAPALMNADVGDHKPRSYTALDLAGLKDIGWEVSLPGGGKPVPPPVIVPIVVPPVPPDPAPVPPPPPPLAPLRSDQLTILTPGEGRVGTVLAYNPNGTLRAQFTPYGGFTGGVRAAAGELTGDGYADIVTGPGPGLPAELRAYDGTDQHLIRAWLAYEESFTGGVFVAAADLNGDGVAEVVTSPDVGGGPRIRVFDGRTGLGLADFLGIDDPAFRGGCRIALGDLNGDGVPDLVVAAGAGGGPRVATFDGASLARGKPEKVTADFFIFEPVLRDGVFVALGDIDGDGRADLVVGAGPGGGPRVFIAGGKELVESRGAELKPIANFFAGDSANRGGVRVAVKDLGADGQTQLVVTPGKTAGSTVLRYASTELVQSRDPRPLSAKSLYDDGFNGGVFVG